MSTQFLKTFNSVGPGGSEPVSPIFPSFLDIRLCAQSVKKANNMRYTSSSKIWLRWFKIILMLQALTILDVSIMSRQRCHSWTCTFNPTGVGRRFKQIPFTICHSTAVISEIVKMWTTNLTECQMLSSKYCSCTNWVSIESLKGHSMGHLTSLESESLVIWQALNNQHCEGMVVYDTMIIGNALIN